MAGKEPMGSACAPPSGSLMMSSITPNLTSSWAVMRSASVACAVIIIKSQTFYPVQHSNATASSPEPVQSWPDSNSPRSQCCKRLPATRNCPFQLRAHETLFGNGKQTTTPRHAEFFIANVSPTICPCLNIQGMQLVHGDATLQRTLAVLSLDFHRMAAQASGEAT